jgi:predicted lipoprotein with Yx(FWY)xxD motif
MKSTKLRTRAPMLLAGAAAVFALALLAGCGSSSNDSSSSSSGTSSTAEQPTAPATGGGAKTATDGVVNVDDNADLGQILVDSKGRTLYYFLADQQNGPSTCSGACAAAWPPFTVDGGKPTAGPGATASMLGTTKRDDGTTEVTYNGWPLYYYAGDAAAGDTNGNNLDEFGAEWYALTPAGVKPAGS